MNPFVVAACNWGASEPTLEISSLKSCTAFPNHIRIIRKDVMPGRTNRSAKLMLHLHLQLTDHKPSQPNPCRRALSRWPIKPIAESTKTRSECRQGKHEEEYDCQCHWKCNESWRRGGRSIQKIRRIGWQHRKIYTGLLSIAATNSVIRSLTVCRIYGRGCANDPCIIVWTCARSYDYHELKMFTTLIERRT